MKKYLIIALLLTMSMNAQMLQKIGREYTTITVGFDPHASITENGTDVFGEFTLVSYFGYVKVGTQIFPQLKGGYIDITGGIGFNQKSALLGVETRIFEGIKGGFIFREGQFPPYGLFAIETGFDIKIGERSYIGSKIDYTYRDDMRYSYSPPTWQFSYGISYIHEL